jgi:thymidylate synthase (FAD)
MVLQLDPLNDNISRIELIDSMGSDLTVVNNARASFSKESTKFNEKDEKLISYLIKHKHHSPLRGVVFQFKVKAPLYIARQWVKHMVSSTHTDEQLQFNETSFRYVEATDPNEFYIPKQFRQQSKNNKQSTEGFLEPELNDRAIALYRKQCESSYQAYSQLLALGVGREQARGVLVPSVYTSWVWTTSLQAALNFVDLRSGHGAQSEIQLYAEAIKELIIPIVPHTMEAWAKYNSNL